jgi:hypothetical protein
MDGAVGNRGARPRLRGPGKQRDIVTHVLKFTYGLSRMVRDFDWCPNLTVSAKFEARRDRARHACWHQMMCFSAHHGLASGASLHGLVRTGRL